MDATKLIYQPVTPNSGDTSFADAFSAVAARSTELRLVSPFLGAGVLVSLTDGRRFRLVTDLGACFEAGADDHLVSFLSRNALHIRDAPGVHAKVVLGDTAALIGSANLTQQAICNRLEMACLLRGEPLTRQLSEWFEALWVAAKVVAESDVRTLAQKARSLDSSRRTLSARLTDHLRTRRGSLGWLATSVPERPKGRAGWAPNTPSRLELAELDELADQVRRLVSTRAEALLVLDTLREGLEVTGLEVDDDRLHLNFGNGRISVTVGQRYVSWLEGTRPYMGFLLDDFDVAREVTETLAGADSDAFTRAGVPDVPSLYMPVSQLSDLPKRARASWHRGIRAETERASPSSYRAKKRRSLHFILRQPEALVETARCAFPQGWWFGANNGSRGHMQLSKVLPLLRREVNAVEWPIGQSKPRAAYREMLPGDQVLVWTGHGKDPSWGVLGTAVLIDVREDRVVLGEGEAFPQPLTPYPKSQPMETSTVRFLRDQLGADFAPLGDVLRAVFSTPRRHPVTVARVPIDVLLAIEARGQGG